MNMTLKHLLLLLFLFTCSLSLNAQKVDDGYRGGHIKGISKLKKALNFITFGDWGRNGGYFQTAVAQQMSDAAYDIDPDFFLVTGDNFYPNGVRSVHDEQWIYSYHNIYKTHPLQTDWYVALGNHDYRGNPDAQIDYTKISRRWNMPARYYAKTFSIDDDPTQQVLVLVIDTNPFIKKYYEEDGIKEGVSAQDTTAQKRWLEQQLQNIPPSVKWTIVVGHHPAYTGSKRMTEEGTASINHTFKPMFDKYGVDFYICGHDHSLQYIKPEGATHYLVSGAGSEATPTILYPKTGKFAAGTGGFMTFSMTAKAVLLQIIDHKGSILYKTTIEKN
jgi:tartrate-resistant acid phosphatase type 5